MTEGLTDLERLLALEELRTLRGRYWRYVDTKRWTEFGELYAPDGSFSDKVSDFFCETREGIVAAVSGALEGVTSIHHGQQSELEVLSADRARGIWSMSDILLYPPESDSPYSILRGWGHYVDEYVKIDGRWLFQRVDLYRLRVETVTESKTEYPPDWTV